MRRSERGTSTSLPAFAIGVALWFMTLAFVAPGAVAAASQAATTQASGTNSKAATGPSASVNPAILNAPGYQPPADPESMSVVIGRRMNAPLVKMSFAGGTRTFDDLGRWVCRALHHSSVDSLRDALITYEELSVILWPEFPQSRPITGLTADDAWLLLRNRNHGGISRALQSYGGRHLQFVRWDRAETVTVYKNFKLHNQLTLVVTNEDGKEEWLDIVRSVAERKGRFKLYSLKD